MRRNLFTQRGNASFAMIVVGVALAAGTVGILKSIDRKSDVKTDFKLLQSGRVMVDKVKTMGNFLVSNGVIACKEQAFQSQSDGYKCEWTGRQISGGKLKAIEAEKLGITRKGYDDKGFLVMDVDFTNIVQTSSDGKETTEKVSDIELKGTLGFKLYNPEVDNDPWNLKGKLGSIPEKYRHADKDKSFVIMKVEVERNRRNDDDDDKLSKSKLKGFFAVRRPLALASIELDDANCRTACDVSVTQDNNPSCRGAQKSEGKFEEVELKGFTTNLGPGILYGLKLEKSVEFDAKFFKTDLKGAPVQVQAMPNRDYLMPGESVEWTDSVTCRTYESTTTRTVSQSRSRGTCREGGRTVPCPVNGSLDSVNIGQHSEPGGSVKYGLDITDASEDKTTKTISFEEQTACLGSTSSTEAGSDRWLYLKLDDKGVCDRTDIQKTGWFSYTANLGCYIKENSNVGKCRRNVKDGKLKDLLCQDENYQAKLDCTRKGCRVCKTTLVESIKEEPIEPHAGLSDVEPKRIARTIEKSGDVPMMHVERVIIRIIATH